MTEGTPGDDAPTTAAVRDIAEIPAVAVIQAAAVHLMSAAAVKCGLAEDTDEVRGADLADLDEARKLITALAGLVTAAAPEIGNQHARSLRDGLRSEERRSPAWPASRGTIRSSRTSSTGANGWTSCSRCAGWRRYPPPCWVAPSRPWPR